MPRRPGNLAGDPAADLVVLVLLTDERVDGCCPVSGVRVSATIHVVSAACQALTAALPVPPQLRVACHRLVLDSLRPLLRALDLMNQLQTDFQALERRHWARSGSWRHRLAVVDPVLLHDASTLYLECAASLFGGTCRFRLPRSCDKCGEGAWWALSCTPPRLLRYRGTGTPCGLTRDAKDQAVAFCLGCLSRRTAEPLELVLGWDCPGVPTSTTPRAARHPRAS